MRRFWIGLSLVLVLSTAPSSLFAHFLWIAAGKQSNDGKVHVYFSESASPDDPELLDKITDQLVWQYNREGQPVALKTVKENDSLTAEAVAGVSPVFALTRNYGVMSRGKETFLLKYHAKCQPLADTHSWRMLKDTERQPLEIGARRQGDQTVFTVLWKGQPVADLPVTIVGPGIDSKLESPTNAAGEATFELKSPGLYSIRTKQTEALGGEQNGQAYATTRHYATLALTVGDALATAAPRAAALPVLDPGITSFGAALVDDCVYVYGGHFGKPHHYSQEGQSDALLRLNLHQPAAWETVSHGPKRTGLAAVSHGGKIYRIGGFEARNRDADKQSLWSMPDFARFDPATQQWEQLTPLPAGRSSHDAVVAGDLLYVVGGWELQGEGESKWHDTAYTVDLSAPVLQWKELPQPPHLRRALSLGEWNGKIYAIGGMQPEGGPTTQTMVYDPQTGAWSDGPRLNGEPMEGFGSSAFLCGKTLCVTTFAGNLQQLSDDGSQWVNSGKLTFPRFFHRMLPLNTNEVLILGGASMQSGKIKELETVAIQAGGSSN